MRAAVLALGLVITVAVPAHAQEAASSAARLQITGVADSTITLNRAGVAWLRAKHRGIVVDPRRNDALIARFRVLSVNGDSAVALLTGLTSPVARQHVALVDPPQRRWYTHSLFWSGAMVGAMIGVAAGASF